MKQTQKNVLLIGGPVRWYTSKGWFNGKLLELGRKWARVEHVVLGRKKVAVADLAPGLE